MTTLARREKNCLKVRKKSWKLEGFPSQNDFFPKDFLKAFFAWRRLIEALEGKIVGPFRLFKKKVLALSLRWHLQNSRAGSCHSKMRFFFEGGLVCRKIRRKTKEEEFLCFRKEEEKNFPGKWMSASKSQKCTSLAQIFLLPVATPESF